MGQTRNRTLFEGPFLPIKVEIDRRDIPFGLVWVRTGSSNRGERRVGGFRKEGSLASREEWTDMAVRQENQIDETRKGKQCTSRS